MAKKKKRSPVSKPVITAVVCPADSVNPTAFRLGFHHGLEKTQPRKPERFVYAATAIAYALGYTAGCAARNARRDAE